MSQQLWDEGTYRGTVRTIAFTESGTKGSPQVEATFLVEGAIKKAFWSLSGGAEEYTLNKLRTIGWNGDPENPECSIGSEEIELTCRHDEYQGKVRERWDIAGGGKPMDRNRARNLAAKFKSTAGVQRPTTPPPSRQAPPKSTPPARTSAPSRTKEETYTDKDAAWAALVKAFTNPSEKKFYEAVDRVSESSGKGELQFGESEWTAVVNEFIPL